VMDPTVSPVWFVTCNAPSMPYPRPRKARV
jgi:hypothetical protein